MPLNVDFMDGRNFRLAREVSYRTEFGELSTVRKGFVYDFASVPRLFWRLLPPTGDGHNLYGIAATWHDWLYVHRKIGGRSITRREADDIFLEIMKYLDVLPMVAATMYRAVRAFGWISWARGTKRVVCGFGLAAALLATPVAARTVVLLDFGPDAVIPAAPAVCVTNIAESTHPTPLPPVVTNAPAPPVSTLQPAQVQWLRSRGPDYSKAKTVLALREVRISGERCHFKPEPAIPWPRRGDKGVNAIGVLIRRIGGKYVGGKIEWVVGSRGWFDVRTNINEGYNGHTMPARGETVWVGLGNPDNGSSISEIVEAKWP